MPYRVLDLDAVSAPLGAIVALEFARQTHAIAAREPKCSGKPGRQQRVSDLAIETVLTPRLVFHLPLRQAEGFR